MADHNSAPAAPLAAATAASALNEQIVTQTLGKVNKIGGEVQKLGGLPGAPQGMADTYDLSKKVLSAVYEGKGGIADADG